VPNAPGDSHQADGALVLQESKAPQKGKAVKESPRGDVPVPEDLSAEASKSLEPIWDMRVMGHSVYEISRSTGLAVEKVNELLERYHRSIKSEGIELHRQLTLSRIEALLRVYLPQAIVDSVTVERIRAGEPVAEEDVEHPLRCAAFCLAALKFIGELLNLRAVPGPLGSANRLSTLDWLQTQRAFIQKEVAQAPCDTLELPSGHSDASSREDLGLDNYKESNPEMEFAEIPTRSQSAGVLPHEDVLSQAEQSRAERRRLFEEAGFDAL